MDEETPAAAEGEETAAEATDNENEGTLEDDADKTMFRNLYIPSFHLPDDEVETASKKQPYDFKRESTYEVPLSDPEALKYCDTTRVGWKGRVDYALDAYRAQRRKAEATEHEIQRDPTALLNVTITTVILLASGIYDIPMEYYLYTELYLLSIRDEFNDSPPNIENLIKHIRFIRKSNNISWQDEYVEAPPPGVIISKIPNRSRIPLPIHTPRKPASPPKEASDTNAGQAPEAETTEPAEG